MELQEPRAGQGSIVRFLVISSDFVSQLYNLEPEDAFSTILINFPRPERCRTELKLSKTFVRCLF